MILHSRSRLSCVGGEKRARYTLAQFSQDFWEFGNFRKICSVTLTSTMHPDFSHIRHLPPTTLRVDDDEGVLNVLSSLLAGIVHVFIHSS